MKPDLVVYNNSNTFNIDLQVINDQYSLDRARENKVGKYSVLNPQLDPLRPKGAIFTSLTTNWRGMIAPKVFHL